MSSIKINIDCKEDWDEESFKEILRKNAEYIKNKCNLSEILYGEMIL